MTINVIVIICALVLLNFGTSYSQIAEEWRRYYGSPDGFTDYPSSITTDNSGNAVVSSTVFFKATFQDIAVSKYSPGGAMMWVKYFNSEDSSNDRAHSVITDNSGNIIITGESMRRETGKDIITIMYNSEGVELWRRTYNGNGKVTAWNNDEGCKVLKDINGDILVGGSSQSTNSGYDFILLKYDNSGNLIYERRFSGPGNRNDKLVDMKTDGQGNIYLTGEGYYASTDFLTLKYNSSGNLLWSARLNGTFSFGEYAKSLTVDKDGNIAVTGYSLFEIFLEDIVLVKYSPEGTELWRSFYNGTADLNDKGFSVDCDVNGNFYVAGYTTNSTSFPEYSLLKYSLGGNVEWVRLYDHNTIGSGEASYLKVDPLNNIIVTGSISRAYSQYSYDDIVTTKYNTSGDRIWIKIFNGKMNEFDRVKALHLDINSNIYIAGTSQTVNQDDIVVCKYSQSSNIKLSSESIPENFTLEQNYPNPFNSQTVIKFSLPSDGYASMKLYDLTGKEISNLFDSFFSKGVYEFNFNAGNTDGGFQITGGVYFYILNAGGKMQTRKLVLLK